MATYKKVIHEDSDISELNNDSGYLTSVATNSIADDAVTNSKIASAAIGSGELSSGAVATAKIADSAVTNAKIANGAVDRFKLASGAIRVGALSDGCVETAKIQDDAVNQDKLATDAVTDLAIKDNAVTSQKIAADAITGAKIADDVIDSEHYVTRSIDTDHLQHSAVTAVKLNVSGNGGLTDYLKSKGDGSFEWETPPNTNTTYTLDLTENNPDLTVGLNPSTGSTQYWNLTSEGSIGFNTDESTRETSVDVTEGSITTARLDSNSVTNAKLGNASVSEAKLGVNSVTPAKANLGWHTQTKIFVSPEEFSPNDHQNYGNVAMHSNGGSARMTYNAIEGYANVMIPSGYKVTHFRINGTSSVSISVHSSTCATSSETSVSPPSSLYTNSTYQTNPTTGILADDTNGKYFILGWLPTSTSQYLYGAILTIAKI